jgi:hypothetical protein
LVPDFDPAVLEQFRKSPSERSRFTIKDEANASVPYSMEEIMSSAKQDDYWF